jgi:hypothetical protein
MSTQTRHTMHTSTSHQKSARDTRESLRPAHSPVLLPARLRETIPNEEFDYQTLMQVLQAYSSPRDKVTDLLAKGIIVRVKKGLYVFGASYRRRPIMREVLANLVYGPSYISLEYALQYHGLIPEAVETMTSVTTGRSRRFQTPVGSFTYRMIPLRAFRVGMDLAEAEGGASFFIATPEKAIADKLVAEKGMTMRDVSMVETYLMENLRIPPVEIGRLDARRVGPIATAYQSRRVALLRDLVVAANSKRNGAH